MRTFSLLLLVLALPLFSPAQQTVGLFDLDSTATEGYTLFAPFTSNSTFLIDNCGRKVHEWTSTDIPGTMARLRPDGQLLRAEVLSQGNFSAGGGAGGQLSLYDWNSNRTWQYVISDSVQRQHHDVISLPNGNVMALVWVQVSPADAIALGRTSGLVHPDGLWDERIIEIQPVGSQSGTVVWEWSALDHLIQDVDSTRPDFGVVGDHPERLDINFVPRINTPDWLHFNGLDYNPALDQVVVSSNFFNEIYIIDHSTTTAEAASSTGGHQGKGGDLLYRWGNPEAYQQGVPNDRRLFAQHDPRWIPPGYPQAGQLSLYNNGLDRKPPAHSTIELLELPVDAQGAYALTGNVYGPAAATNVYGNPTDQFFYSAQISGAQMQPNGNFVICQGQSGRLFEVDSLQEIVWDYINPVSQAIADQGQSPGGNFIFKVDRYLPGYPGLAGQSLAPGDRLEGNPLPLPAECIVAGREESPTVGWRVYPQPAGDFVEVERTDGAMDGEGYRMWDGQGKLVRQGQWTGPRERIDLEPLPAGLYIFGGAGEWIRIWHR